MNDSQRRLVEVFDRQIGWCEALGSPLYVRLLTVARDDIARGGVVHDIVRDAADDPVDAAVSLRLMGGVHRLVLMGVAERLAEHYPSVGGSPDPTTVGEAFMGVVADHTGYLRDALRVAPQTNDVGRSALLLAGLAHALDGRRLKVRLMGLGSAGGLNLLLDRYRYDFGGTSWGDPASPARITTTSTGSMPKLPGSLRIMERRGCDVNPMDITDPEAQLRLLSFIWPDQIERFVRTRGAISVAQVDPPIVARADAAEWLAARLDEPTPPNVMTVVQHSVMWQYLPTTTKDDLRSLIDAAGARATRRRPFAHVAFEPSRAPTERGGLDLSVTVWPRGEPAIIAHAHAHGRWIDWTR